MSLFKPALALVAGVAVAIFITSEIYERKLEAQEERHINEMFSDEDDDEDDDDEADWIIERPPLLTDEAREELRAQMELNAAIYVVNEGITDAS